MLLKKKMKEAFQRRVLYILNKKQEYTDKSTRKAEREELEVVK